MEPHIVFKVRSVCIIFCLHLSAVKDEITAINILSNHMKNSGILLVDRCNYRTKGNCLQVETTIESTVTYSRHLRKGDAVKCMCTIKLLINDLGNILKNQINLAVIRFAPQAINRFGHSGHNEAIDFNNCRFAACYGNGGDSLIQTFLDLVYQNSDIFLGGFCFAAQCAVDGQRAVADGEQIYAADTGAISIKAMRFGSIPADGTGEAVGAVALVSDGSMGAAAVVADFAAGGADAVYIIMGQGVLGVGVGLCAFRAGHADPVHGAAGEAGGFIGAQILPVGDGTLVAV